MEEREIVCERGKRKSAQESSAYERTPEGPRSAAGAVALSAACRRSNLHGSSTRACREGVLKSSMAIAALAHTAVEEELADFLRELVILPDG